jgi:CBS domain-containing protein
VTIAPTDLSAARAWPFEEARKVAARVEKSGKGEALFETGYGPSGLPHIGTFGEVARTTWVRRAFELLTGKRSRLIAFSDDMDGLRKVPDNVPNKEMLATHLGRPVTAVPDPFGTHESFGHHNNARLRAFLERTGGSHSDKPEVVGQIMNARVRTALDTAPAVELVPLMADIGHHHVPIVDAEQRLVGMVTQSDLVATIYEICLAQPGVNRPPAA